MQEAATQGPQGIYRLTSVARPVDPAYPTNRALLFVLPVGSLLFAGLALAGVISTSATAAAFSALLIGFASWALTRELSPDDDVAAFIAILMAWTMYAVTGASNVILIFVALFLVRIVNRSTGIAARPWDTLLVMGFALYGSWSLGQPLLALLAGLAFGIDAYLDRGRPLQIAAAMVGFIFAAWQLTVIGVELPSGISAWALPSLVIIACLITAVLWGPPSSVCDAFGKPLEAARVSLGLTVGSLVGLQSFVHGTDWVDDAIWASLAAVPVSALIRSQLKRRFAAS